MKKSITKSQLKPTNPKDLVGASKIPFHLIPKTGLVEVALAMLDGALKYGRSNYRAIGVRSSIYYDAAFRHLEAWFEGEDFAPDSGVHHLGHAIACFLIILDSRAKGNLRDDRMFPGSYLGELKKRTKQVKLMKEKYAALPIPTHYTLESFKDERRKFPDRSTRRKTHKADRRSKRGK